MVIIGHSFIFAATQLLVLVLICPLGHAHSLAAEQVEPVAVEHIQGCRRKVAEDNASVAIEGGGLRLKEEAAGQGGWLKTCLSAVKSTRCKDEPAGLIACQAITIL